MESTQEIKRRIKSINNTKQITRAMEMVAAAKLRNAEARVEKARPYEAKMETTIARIINQVKTISHPLMKENSNKVPGYLIIAADRGLCGGYNNHNFKEAVKQIEEHHSDDHKLIVVGRKSREFFRKRDYDVMSEYIDLEDYPSFKTSSKISQSVKQLFLDGVIGELYVVYSEFKNAMTHIPTTKQVLPMTKETLSADIEVDKEELGLDDQLYSFEPSPEWVLGGLLERYLESVIFRALLEAKASEQGARMTAMKSATDNAGDIIDELTLTYNKARQSAITTELLDIVGGAEALK